MYTIANIWRKAIMDEKSLTGIVSLSNLMTTGSLSATEILKKNKSETLSVRITPEMNNDLIKIAKQKRLGKQDISRIALAEYIERNSYCLNTIFSSYYERDFCIHPKIAAKLLKIYFTIAKQQGFNPIVKSISELINDTELLDHVLYQVNTFGKEHEDYTAINYLFEENTENQKKGEEKMKKIKQLNGFIVKEKRIDEIPLGIDEERKYCVFKDDIFLEDNLTIDEAISFCKEN